MPSQVPREVRRKRHEPGEEAPRTEGFAAVGLHRPSRPENIGGVFRAADVYEVRLVVLGGGEPPASRRLRVCRRARDDVEIRACRTPRPPHGVGDSWG